MLFDDSSARVRQIWAGATPATPNSRFRLTWLSGPLNACNRYNILPSPHPPGTNESKNARVRRSSLGFRAEKCSGQGRRRAMTGSINQHVGALRVRLLNDRLLSHSKRPTSRRDTTALFHGILPSGNPASTSSVDCKPARRPYLSICRGAAARGRADAIRRFEPSASRLRLS